MLAVDIGGTKIAFADVSNGSIEERSQIPTPRTGRGSDLVAAITAEANRRGPTRIAVATTGIVSGGRLTALNPGTLPIEDGFPLAEAVEAATGLRPLVVNDAQAAAWGEYRFGAGRGCRSFMFVTVSTGVGAGLVMDGRLHAGRAGLAGHLGHVSARGPSTQCGCGRRGCLEPVAGGWGGCWQTAAPATAIARGFRVAPERGTAAPEIFEAAASGDALAEQVIEDAAAALSGCLADAVALVDVERVAIGGGVGLAPGFLERVERHLSNRPPPFVRPVVHASGGSDAGMIGVSDLAMKENFIN